MLRNRLYYTVKPLLPLRIRFAIRRWFALRNRRRVESKWPIAPGSELPPEGWSGWPHGKKFALVLTHDVESKAGLAKVRRLMQFEQELGFRSCFNLIPEGEYVVPRELRDELVRNGFEVGVHDLYHNGKLFLAEKDFRRNAVKINHYLTDWSAVGFRSGFMLHNLDWIHKLNVVYDASTFDTDPFEPQPHGQNTIFPFWVSPSFNGVQGSSNGSNLHSPGCGYVELPYTLPQDSTLFLLLQERHPDIWFHKLDWIARHGGMALVNVHPDYIRFAGEQSPFAYPIDVYRRFLEYVRERYNGSYWQPLPKELAGWHADQARRPSAAAAVPGLAGLSRRAREVLRGARAAVVLYSGFPSDPRPRRELESLIQQGMQADLICLSEDPSEPAREDRGLLRVTRLSIRHKREGKLRYFWQYSRFFFQSFWLLGIRSMRGRYDLVHVHNMPDFLVFSALIPRLLGARVILDLHDPMPELYETIFRLRHNSPMVRLLLGFERWSIKFAHAVLTPNEAFRRLFSSRGNNASKIHILMNTPDERIFGACRKPAIAPAAGSRHPGFRIMYHGLIAERHGLVTAIDAVGLLSTRLPGLVLDIYGGRNPFLERISRRAEQLGLNGCVRYHGKKRIDDIPALILQADIGIIPNRRTPFTEINLPTRIFEYLSLGKPVIVPKTKGVRDYFGDDQIVYFEPDDAEDLARKLEWAYFHPEELRKIVCEGQKVYEQHRWEIEREGFFNLVESLLQTRARAKK